MNPLLYGEQDLLPLPAAPLEDGIPSWVSHWKSATSAGERHARIRCTLRTCGFHWMSHASLDAVAGGFEVTKVFASHEDRDWIERYYVEGRYRDDPRLLRACGSALPQPWSMDGRSGVLMWLPPGFESPQHTLISLSSQRAGTQWLAEPVLGLAAMLALALHEWLSVHVVQRGVHPASELAMSATRREILRHLAQGQSNKQIAHRMQLSADTVKYHLSAMRRQLNVRNRMQLANCRREPHAGQPGPLGQPPRRNPP